MVAAGLTDFLLAIIGASASFIGLLFVGLTFVTSGESDTSHEFIDKRLLAESSYAALLNIFFVSIVALIPDNNLGYVLLVMALFGLGGTLRLFKISEKKHRTNVTLLISTLVYVGEGIYALYVLFQNSSYYIDNYIFMTIILFLFGISLARAWELTGIRQHGIKS